MEECVIVLKETELRLSCGMCERQPSLPTSSINDEDRFRFFRRPHIRHADLSSNAVSSAETAGPIMDRTSNARHFRFISKLKSTLRQLKRIYLLQYTTILMFEAYYVS